MQTQPSPMTYHREHERPLSALSARVAPAARRRVALSAVLMAIGVLLGGVLFLAFGWTVLVFYLPGVPLAFVLLWCSADVFRADESRYARDVPVPAS